MASAQPPVANTNGSYLQQADPQSFQTNPSTAAPVPNYQTQGGTQQPSANPESVPKDEVGWYFVEQYYTTLNRTPERLHLFYNKKSSFVWGTEGGLLQLATGRPAIQEKIQSYEFKDCKVRVSNVDSQASADNGIVIQVLGEMSNNSLPNRKFSQTFFLAEQPNGYYVLNDIFRYLKDDEDTEEGEDYDSEEEHLEGPLVEAVVNEAVEIAVDELVEAVEDMNTKETTKTEIEIEGDKIKIEETVTVEPALPVPEAQVALPPVNGNAQSANGDSPIVESEYKAETETETETGVGAVAEAEAEAEVEAEVEVGAEVEAGAEAEAEADADTKVEAEVDAGAEQEQEQESQVEEPIAPNPQAITEAMPPPQAEEKKAAPPPVKEHERAHTPIVAPKPTPPPAPKTWASLVATNTKPSAAQNTTVPAARAQPSPVQSVSAVTPATIPVPTAASNTPATPTGGPQWQTAKHSRGTSVAANAGTSPTSASIKNVPGSVGQQVLEDALSKFGPLKRCEINTQKNIATIEFETPAGFAAAAAANPHKIGDATINIEERRPRPTAGAGYGGRGISGRDSRPGGQGGRGFRGEGRGTTGGRGRGGGGGGYNSPRGGGARTGSTSTGPN